MAQEEEVKEVVRSEMRGQCGKSAGELLAATKLE